MEWREYINMKILVINAGSSSLKYQLINMEDESVIAKGNCERIGVSGAIAHKTIDGYTYNEDCAFPTHTEAFEKLIKVLTMGERAVIKDMNEIAAVGHRIVQGGKYFNESVLATEEVISKIEEISDLAPLHNPAHILALRACQSVLPSDVPQVVVFDTAFQQTMPEKAYMYGLPYEYYEKYQIRKYGFHGTSHRFVTNRLGEIWGCDMSDKKIVTCHLGNGSSVAAVKNGECIDTSMGFTPLDGLIMGSRSGAIDPSVVLYIMQQEKLSTEQMNDILNKKSGFLGMSELTSDSRDLIDAAKDGNKQAQIAVAMFRYQIKKYISSYAAAMGGIDAVVFTGGIGENSDELRYEVCEGLEFMGVELDNNSNTEFNHEEARISKNSSKVEVWIVPTNEELLIARDTKVIITQ